MANRLLQYQITGPTIVPLLQQLAASIKAGRGHEEISEAEWTVLSQLAQQSAADIYKKQGIEPPPV